jgi:hypothetical protein
MVAGAMEVDDWCCWNEEEEQIYLISHIWFWWESYLLVLKLLVVSDFCKVAGYRDGNGCPRVRVSHYMHLHPHPKLTPEPEPKPKGCSGGKSKPTPTPIGFGFFHPNPNPQQDNNKITIKIKLQ